MLHKLGANNLPKHFAKTMLGMMMALISFGIGAKAYSYQELPPRVSGNSTPVTITEFGCVKRTCTIRTNAGKDHFVTSGGTASCDPGIFAWDNIEKPQIGKTVEKAIRLKRPVHLRYDEYRCYDGTQEGFGHTMALLAIWILY